MSAVERDLFGVGYDPGMDVSEVRLSVCLHGDQRTEFRREHPEYLPGDADDDDGQQRSCIPGVGENKTENCYFMMIFVRTFLFEFRVCEIFHSKYIFSTPAQKNTNILEIQIFVYRIYVTFPEVVNEWYCNIGLALHF